MRGKNNALPRRFTIRDDEAHDHWQNEKLALVSLANQPQTLARLHGIFAFRSSLLQNIADVAADHFRIRVLTQPFAPSRPAELARLPQKAKNGALRHSLAFLAAAEEWGLDFVDFSRVQLLPSGMPRFAWKLEPQELPPPAAIVSLFGPSRRDRGRPAPEAGDALAGGAAFLCRREDFASNLLHSGPAGSLRTCANARIRINIKHPWQGAVARDNLFQNLVDAETLLLNIDLSDLPLGRCLASLTGGSDAGGNDLAAQARKFRLFMKQSVFQKAVLLLGRLARREDDRLLRFLLESGEICGVTAILFDDATACGCDLEFNEDPPNLLAKHLPAAPAHAPAPELDDRERGLLERLAAIGVPVPRESARLLFFRDDDPDRPPGDEGDAGIASLLKRRLLVEQSEHSGLTVNLPACPPLNRRDAGAALARLAMKSEWPYARIAHLIAAGGPGELEGYLRRLAGECPGRVAPGPAADLLCRRLLPAHGRALEYGLDILIQGNCLDQAARLLGAVPDAGAPWARLKKAHLALRRRDYPELARLLADTAPPAREWRDEWLYLNFILQEKVSPRGGADAFARKIRSPYYRHLARIRLSDRSIYNREFARAREQLTAALDYFSAGGRSREEIEARSQMAKLLREQGDFTGSEALYKTIFVQGEADGLPLSSAGAAVDLGNLYAENDDDFQAECWYRKAARLYEGERERDGIMLVNANLVNVLLAKGDWTRADDLLRGLLAWNEEKKLLDSSAIDLLNWAGLETLRLRDEKALQLIERAEAIFRGSANSKGLGECAFRRGCLRGFADSPPPRGGPWFSPDQEAVRGLLRSFATAKEGREGELARRLEAIGSRKARFEALRLLLRKHRRGEWLERFKELAWELSPRAKNYYFYEYWYMYFDLASGDTPAGLRGEFLAMIDFFSANKRALSPRLIRLRQQCEEVGRGIGLFADARLVEQHRQWRLPVDFFNGFRRALTQAAPVDWLLMSVQEKQRPLFRFASSDQFRDLGQEMLQDAAATPLNQNHGLDEVQRKYRSPERLFYPFACTKLIRWPLAEDILACLVVASRDGALIYQDLYARQRELFKKFSLLFRNFLQNEYRIDEKLDFIVGASPAIREMKRRIAQVSKVDFSLLVSGESGSGKELVARAVHRLSPRAGQPFVSVNAAAIPDTLLEAELFGFRKGAFSGAGENRVGLLEAADRGTLFLDEIADLPLALQAKLLRALQEREIRRLGENKTIHVDVRLVSASNRDLGELIRKQLFRADLFYRLQDLVIRIPPLRERREDIPLLIGHFLRKFGYPPQGADRLDALADMFRDDDFPGNVRELESRIKNVITFHPDLEFPPRASGETFSWRSARRAHEKELLLKTLKEQDWQRQRTAERLGISRMALFNLLKKHRIAP